jgi:hypothetical protein
MAELETRLKDERHQSERHLAEEMSSLIDAERQHRRDEAASDHVATIAEVSGLVEAVLDRNRTDVAWMVAEAMKQADHTQGPALGSAGSKRFESEHPGGPDGAVSI